MFFLMLQLFELKPIMLFGMFVMITHVTLALSYNTDSSEPFTYPDYLTRAMFAMQMFVQLPGLFISRKKILALNVKETVFQELKRSQEIQHMFDSIQDGVIVFQNDKLHFMNELSNQILSQLSKVADFFKTATDPNSEDTVSPLDIKLFYVFDSENSGSTIPKKKRRVKR